MVGYLSTLCFPTSPKSFPGETCREGISSAQVIASSFAGNSNRTMGVDTHGHYGFWKPEVATSDSDVHTVFRKHRCQHGVSAEEAAKRYAGSSGGVANAQASQEAWNQTWAYHTSNTGDGERVDKQLETSRNTD
jgi:hypothetical protein